MRERHEESPEQEEKEIMIPIVEEGATGNSEASRTDPEATVPAEEAETLRNKWLRAAADLENLRKRTARDVELARARERENLLRSFLDVLDNLERALDTHGAESNPWLEGLEAIQQQMLDVLKTYGATPFQSIGELFDPNRHEAVATVNLPDKESGQIVDVTQVGYAMNTGTVLRPAKVIVAQ